MSKIDEQILETERKLQELKNLKNGLDPKIAKFLADEGFDDQCADGEIFYGKCVLDDEDFESFYVNYDGSKLFLESEGDTDVSKYSYDVSNLKELKEAYNKLSAIDEFEVSITDVFKLRYLTVFAKTDIEMIEEAENLKDGGYCDCNIRYETSVKKVNG